MEVVLDVSGEVKNEVELNDPSTLVGETKFAVVVREFAVQSSNQKAKRVKEVTSSKNTALSYKKNVNVPKNLDTTDIELKLKPIDITLGFEEMDMLISYYGNVLQVMNKGPSKESQQIAQEAKSIDAEAILEKAAPKSSPAEKPKLLCLKTNIKADIERLKLVCLQPGTGKQPQWMELNVQGGLVNLELTESKEKKDMKGLVTLKTLKGTLFKQVTRDEELDYEAKEETVDSVKALVFGFEDFKSDLSAAEDINVNLVLHKLYMKYVEKNRRGDYLVASDFQEVISNPLVKSKDGVNQLEIALAMKKDDETTIRLLYNDFRIIISPPVILGLLETSSSLSLQLSTLLSKLPQTSANANLQPEVVKVDPKASLPTKRLKFNGELTNIEIWIPRTVETNKSRVCQLSFTTKVAFSSIEELRENKLENRVTNSSLEVQQLKFIMLNKHLLKDTEDISKASHEVLIPPTKICFSASTVEDPTGLNKITADNKITTIRISVERIRVTVGFREIDLFKSLADYYDRNLLKVLPKTETKKTGSEMPETKVISYSTNMVQVDFKMDPVEFVLCDDTEIIEQELFKVVVSGFMLEMSQTTLLDESRRSLLAIHSDLLNLNGSLLLEILFYNNFVAEYEPIIEKWGLKYDITQFARDYGKEIKINARDMLNLNISYAGNLRK